VIEIRNLTLHFGSQVIFDDISANISTRDRIALAGRNGAGKTTFLRALTGQEQGDGGSVTVGNELKVGYLPQDGLESRGTTLIEEVESAESDIRELQHALEAAHHEVAEHPGRDDDENVMEAWDLIHRIEGELQLREAHKLRTRAEKVLSGLGFESRDFERDTGVFSGGWQMRIALARLLLQQPDYLLLDEPTNHLDLPSQRWLEGILAHYPGGLVLISHDRAFLDQLTRKTFHLRRGQLEIYNGNFSFFERESAHRREILLSQKASQDRKIEKTQQFIDRFRAKANKASQVQSRIKQLEKIDRLEIDVDESSVSFEFPPSPHSGQILLEIKDLHKAYGENKLFNGFSLKIERGQRFAVVGINGAGKSTLAKILAGEESFESGNRTINEKTRIAYFAQHQTDQLDPDKSALECAIQSTGCSEQQARDILGSFLFSGDAALKPVSVLSGGEKNRLALARILLKPANLLILDEPTNHLDIQSKSILQEALKNYDGACFIISHDRDFLDPLVEKTLEISPRGHRLFWCNVSQYIEQTERENSKEAQPQGMPGAGSNHKGMNARQLRKLRAERLTVLAPLRKRVKECELRIESVEEEIARWEEKMRDPSFFSRRPGQAEDMQAYEKAKRNQALAMEEWEKALARLEKAEKNYPDPSKRDPVNNSNS